MLQIHLVSQSPRRSQLLTEAGYEILVDSLKVSEIIEKNLNLEEALCRVAQRKLDLFVQSVKNLNFKDYLFLSADTVVVFAGRVLGKPENSEQAREFLSLLSGQKHQVKTALCLLHGPSGDRFCQVETTDVTFKPLSEQQITDYIATGESTDKAGAYAIQGVGRAFVESIEGSLSNVVGLPMELLERVLDEKEWRVRRRKMGKDTKGD